MAKDSVYRITEIVGTSKKSWEDAAANAVCRRLENLAGLEGCRNYQTGYGG